MNKITERIKAQNRKIMAEIQEYIDADKETLCEIDIMLYLLQKAKNTREEHKLGFDAIEGNMMHLKEEKEIVENRIEHYLEGIEKIKVLEKDLK